MNQTVRLRMLGEHLRALRDERGLTLTAASDLVGRSRSSLGKIEKGQVHAYPRDIAYILDQYGVTDPELRRNLLKLVEEGRKQGWWTPHERTLHPSEVDFVSLEWDSLEVEDYEIALMPGLLQTEDYMESISAPYRTPGSAAARHFVSMRVARQAALTRATPLYLTTVVSEAALHQQIGGRQVMAAQLNRLIEASRLANVSLHVLPYAVGAHQGLDNAFTVLNLRHFSVVNFSSLTGGAFIEEEKDVQRYRAAFNDIRNLALSESATRTLISRLAHDLRAG